MSILKKLAGETVIYGIGGILPRLVNFVVVASYLTFLLKSEVYGIHAILYSFVTLALVLFTLRMETTFFKFGSDKQYNADHIFNVTVSLVLLSSVSLLCIMIAFREGIASILTKPGDERYIVYFGVILFLDAITAVPFGKLRLENRPTKFTIIKVFNSLITVALILFAFNVLPHIDSLASWNSPQYYLDYIFLANLVGSAFVFIMLIKEYRNYKFIFDMKLVKIMLMYAWPLIIVGVAGSINQFSDRFLISYFTAEAGAEQNFDAAGLFTGALKIAVIMNIFVTAFNYAAEPFFFNNSDRESRDSSYGNIALAFTIFGTALFMGVMFYIDIIKNMIDKSYHEALFVVPIALLAYLFLGLYYNLSIWYKLSGKTIYGALISTIGMIIFLTSAYFLIGEYGVIGATIASLLCFSSMCVICYFLGQKHYPIPYPVRKMMLYMLVGVILFLALDSLDVVFWTRIVVGTTILLAYLVFAYVFTLRKIIK